MSEQHNPLDWSTLDGLAAIRQHLADRIEGWRQPVAYGVGLSSASSEWEFPHVNAPGGRHGLPAVVLASVIGHDGSTATREMTTAQLAAAVESLEPAEACADVDHPNLAAWRTLLAEAGSNPARTLAAVFVADLHDPVTSEADATLRTSFEGHAPVTDAGPV